ncbi:hypothetical protein F5Y18DRAFT_397213 [Xylariaceae sp. FL1019]|nr:hypothetical protein F5Y18DRAFT_397213 [Xylariaceae sp. FL1019]
MKLHQILAIIPLPLLTTALTFSANQTHADVDNPFAGLFYKFCSDIDCDPDSCGASLGINDPSCWNESGRKAIRFINGDPRFSPFKLIYSPSFDCPCQSHCTDFGHEASAGELIITNRCFPLEIPGGSFRFIGGEAVGEVKNCPADQC